MFARQLIYLTRNLSLSRKSINNKRILLGTVYSGNVHTKCYSMDHRDEPSSVKTGDNEHRRTEVIKLELENLRNDGCNVPDADLIKAQHWSELLTMNSRSARRKYYHFLYVTQNNIENQNIKKEQKSLAYAAFKERQKNEGAPPPKSRFLLRIYNQTMDRWRNNRLFRAMQFSEKIIFDCSYDQYMNRREANNLADQLQSVFSVNRLNRDPYDVHFCNVNFDGTTFKRLTSLIPNLRNETFPLNLHETSYLDVFPKEKLIYLTPHCKTDLTDYDADKVYIVGAMVDTSNHEPLSMMKAKELGIAMAKLPLERYLDWGQGDKTLTLDQMMKIMLDWRATNSWEKALQHIPRRKIMRNDVARSKGIGKWTANLNRLKLN